MTHDVIICADCEGTPDQLGRVWRVFQENEVKVNFFFVGQTAQENAALVREIAARHCVNSHTFSHRVLRGLPKEVQREEIMRGKHTVEDIIGRPTFGFRAPCHGLDRRTVEILNEEGFLYDLSGLYYRYNMGRVIEIRPTWFREWAPLYGRVGISAAAAWNVFKVLYRLFNPLVMPVHPHYSGLNESHARALSDFLRWALDHGARFRFIPEYLNDLGRWPDGLPLR
ncbi:MAG: hypothetical protein Kow0059_10820 [Candidatus Sumerlaeia bacterium]